MSKQSRRREALLYHAKPKPGKIMVVPTKKYATQRDLSLAYSPEVAEPCLEIEKEVNEGQHFAPLRQIYHSLILAKWYKETVKNSLLSQVYVDKNLIAGVESA